MTALAIRRCVRMLRQGGVIAYPTEAVFGLGCDPDDQQAVLRKCRVPTLILCGEHDQLCPVKRHEFMAELIPYARLHVIENAGHLPTLEQPDETTAALRAWLHQPYVLQ